MSMAGEILDKLIADGNITSGQGFRGQLPSSPDFCVMVNETRPWSPQRVMRKLPAVYWLGLMITVRGNPVAGGYDIAFAKAVQIAENLQGFVGTLGSANYKDITMMAPPSYIGRDEDKRDQFTINFRVCRDAIA